MPVQSAKMDEVSFCKNCGGYLKPDDGSVRLDGRGRPIILCEACDKIRKTRELPLNTDKGE